MVAVWLAERSICVAVRVAAAVLMVVLFRSASSRMHSVDSVLANGVFTVFVFATVVFATIVSESQECFFQASRSNLQTRERGIARQQCAHDRLSFAGVDFYRPAIFLRIGHTRNLQQARHVESRDAADALAIGLGLDFRRRAFGDDLTLTDYRDAVGQGVGFL